MIRFREFGVVLACFVLFCSPFFQRSFPEYSAHPVIGMFAVLILAIPSIIALIQWLGPVKGVKLFSVLAVFAFAIETIGLQTGFPYSSFTYGSGLGPLLPGGAPFALPFAYVPLVLGGVWFLWRRVKLSIPFAAGMAGLLVVVDLVLDPGAVRLGLWSYARGGLYYSVPALNYAGWLLSGAIAGFLSWKLIKSVATAPPVLLALSLLLQLSYWSGVAFWYSLWIPFAIGMLSTLFLGYRMRLTFAKHWPQ